MTERIPNPGFAGRAAAGRRRFAGDDPEASRRPRVSEGGAPSPLRNRFGADGAAPSEQAGLVTTGLGFRRGIFAAVALGAGVCAAAFAAETTAPPTPAAGEAGATPASGDRAPEPIDRVIPVHPRELRLRGIAGQVVVVCTVDERGEVTEAALESASRPEFGVVAVDAVRQWRFSPGLRGGRPSVYRVKVPLEFNLPDTEQLAKVAGRPVFVEISEPILPAETLRTWPMPRNAAMPQYPPGLKGSGKSGRVVVAFVVDPRGKVVNPDIVKTDHEDFSFTALATVLALEFDPIRDDQGKPAYVSMQVQYDFKDESGRPAAGKDASKKKPAK
jgi:TonB family protein